jgi:hypothetical protein
MILGIVVWPVVAPAAPVEVGVSGPRKKLPYHGRHPARQPCENIDKPDYLATTNRLSLLARMYHMYRFNSRDITQLIE